MRHVLSKARLSHAPLAENKAHTFAAKHALSIYRSRSVYTFIPKNACSTLRYSLAIENGAIAGPDDFGWIHNNNWTFSCSLSELVEAKQSFVVLRCPYARLASFYLDKVVGGFQPAQQLLPLMPSVPSLEHMTFRQLAQAMLDPAVRSANNHWRDQVDFLVYEDYSAYFSVERLDEARPAIERLTGLVVQDARQLSGHGISALDHVSDSSYGDATAQTIALMKAQGRVPAPRALYDDEIASAVKLAYATDIDFYARRFGRQDLMF